MDPSALAAQAFHTLADQYQAQFMDLDLYDDTYQQFCECIKSGPARVLDVACGPGNVSRYLLRQRPDLDLLGIDLAPRMVALAQAAVPGARFKIHDCRRLSDLQQRFDGVICAFGLPYLSWDETRHLIHEVALLLEPGGVFYFSTMLGKPEDGGLKRCSSGDQVYLYYHSQADLLTILEAQGFTVRYPMHRASPGSAHTATTDLIVIARKDKLCRA
jgi:ubiquinone/menaquinone biosynthesis C-methylase UbiE